MADGDRSCVLLVESMRGAMSVLAVLTMLSTFDDRPSNQIKNFVCPADYAINTGAQLVLQEVQLNVMVKHWEM